MITTGNETEKAIVKITYRSQDFPEEAFRVITEQSWIVIISYIFTHCFCWGSFRTKKHFKRLRNLCLSLRRLSTI